MASLVTNGIIHDPIMVGYGGGDGIMGYTMITLITPLANTVIMANKGGHLELQKGRFRVSRYPELVDLGVTGFMAWVQRPLIHGDHQYMIR
jgi:hypothetical protein